MAWVCSGSLVLEMWRPSEPVRRPGSGKHVVYPGARFCVKRAEGQAEAARSQRDSIWAHGWGGLHGKSSHPGCLPGELLLPRPACLLLRKLNIVLTLRVHYLKEFHYWRASIEGCIQRWGNKLITDKIYGFRRKTNDVKFPNHQVYCIFKMNDGWRYWITMAFRSS